MSRFRGEDITKADLRNLCVSLCIGSYLSKFSKYKSVYSKLVHSNDAHGHIWYQNDQCCMTWTILALRMSYNDHWRSCHVNCLLNAHLAAGQQVLTTGCQIRPSLYKHCQQMSKVDDSPMIWLWEAQGKQMYKSKRCTQLRETIPMHFELC